MPPCLQLTHVRWPHAPVSPTPQDSAMLMLPAAWATTAHVVQGSAGTVPQAVVQVRSWRRCSGSWHVSHDLHPHCLTACLAALTVGAYFLCPAVCAGSPALPGGNGTFSCGSATPFGSTCTGSCNIGFSGTPNVTCGVGGQWQPVQGTCQQIGEWS